MAGLSPVSTIRHIYTSPGTDCIKIQATDTVFNDLGQKVVCTKKFPCDSCPPMCITVLDFALADFAWRYRLC